MIYSIFFLLFVLGFTALFLTYLLGKIIFNFYKASDNSFLNLFIILIIGITSIFMLFSIIKSGGRTINIILLPVICYIIYYYKHLFRGKNGFHISEIWQEFRLVIIPFIVVFLYQSYLYFNFKTGEIRPLFLDFNWYATISDSLKLWGCESQFTELNYFFPEFKSGLIQYHYSELWLTCFWAQIFAISTIKSYFLIVSPLLISIYAIGICSLFFSSFSNKLIILFISIILLFVSTIIFKYPSFISIFGQTGTKLAIIYIYMLLAFILLKNNDRILGFLIINCLPVLFVSLLPGIFGGIPLFFLIMFLWNKCAIDKIYFRIIIWYFIIVILYFSFYYLFKSNQPYLQIPTSILDGSIFNPLKKGFTFYTIKVTIANCVYYSYESFKIHAKPLLWGILPFVILLFKSHLKLLNIWLLVFSMLFCGIVASRIFGVQNVNSFQFVSNLGLTLVILVNMATAYFVNSIVKNIKPFSVIIVSLLFFLIVKYAMIPTFQDANSWGVAFPDYHFFSKIAKSITKKNPVILIFADFDFPIKFAIRQTSDEVFYIPQVSDNTIIYTIANPEFFLGKHKKLSALEQYNYNQVPINVWRDKGPNYTLETFIEKYKITYCYFSTGIKIPDFIKHKTVSTIESNITHNRLVILK